LAALPLATSAGGQFREYLEAAASKARCRIRIELSGSSFTQGRARFTDDLLSLTI
jgi:hypothetical protein